MENKSEGFDSKKKKEIQSEVHFGQPRILLIPLICVIPHSQHLDIQILLNGLPEC